MGTEAETETELGHGESPFQGRAHQRVLDWVEAQLRAGQLRIGDQLPGERALAETHGISRASVRDAIRTLEVMGLVRTSTGSGPRSGAVLISRPAKGISNMLRLHVASSGLEVEDVVEVRALLETWAATVVDFNEIPDGGREILVEAADLLEMMDDADLTRAEFQALDTRFHVLLAKLAGNNVLDAIMASLKDAIGDLVSASVDDNATWEPIAKVLRGQHREIFHAVQSGEHQHAANLLREHIEWFYSHTSDQRPGEAEHPPRLV
ncbi:FadR/GntR family transcriptional regulator [Galactobacter caseinivorans]|uniref:FadR/GntR family transcriptional regulator n=1 Tax=Galactobacter caseinivorans TaxID=2676123 RepID=UPI001F468EC7|nr:FCD domain-containing protein [Galactobacter caseinivorans]